MNQNQRNKIIEDLLANPNFNPDKLINPNRYVNVLGLDSLVKYQSKEDFDKSQSAKEAWRKYRVNYNIGNLREGVRNSLGLKIDEKTKDSFKY